MMPFDFDELVQLAKTDLVAFEKRKAEIINEYIASMQIEEDKKQRLRALINGLNMELDTRYKNPVARFNEVQARLWIQVEELRTALSNPSSLNIKKSQPDNIIPFGRKPS